jgi:cation:H+ antiporter
LSFVAIWQGAGFIISAIDRIARRMKLSSFAISFFILGILTSIPEIAISATATAEHKPEIFVGTLLGGVLVIFLFIIPFLAILGKGIHINHDLDRKHILATLAVIAAPALLAVDQWITNLEGFFIIIIYCLLFNYIQKKHGIFDRAHTEILEFKAYSYLDLFKVAIGIGLVFLSSQFIVNQTIRYSQLLQIPAFYISLLLLAIGTNLPELSLAVRAVLSGKKDIAFGDYLGSAAANSLVFGIFTLINNGEILTTNSFFMTFVFTIVGLGLFYYFSQSEKNISRWEGVTLLMLYLVFVVYEMIKGF